MFRDLEPITDDFESIKAFAGRGYRELVAASSCIHGGLLSAVVHAYSKNYEYLFSYSAENGPTCDVTRTHHKSRHSDIVARLTYQYEGYEAGTCINLLSRSQALIV